MQTVVFAFRTHLSGELFHLMNPTNPKCLGSGDQMTDSLKELTLRSGRGRDEDPMASHWPPPVTNHSDLKETPLRDWLIVVHCIRGLLVLKCHHREKRDISKHQLSNFKVLKVSPVLQEPCITILLKVKQWLQRIHQSTISLSLRFHILK